MKALQLTFVFLVVQHATAWGPYTHQSMGRFMSDGHGDNAQLGGSSPDIFKHLRPKIHDWIFAGFQAQFAEDYRPTSASSNASLLPPLTEEEKKEIVIAAGIDDIDYGLELLNEWEAEKAVARLTQEPFDPIEYSAGFGAHIVHDAVGHHASGMLPWSLGKLDHPLEFAIDTYCFKEIDSPWTLMELDTEAGVEFVLAAVNAFAEQELPFEFDPPTREELLDEVKSFRKLTNTEWLAIKANFMYKTLIKKMSPYEPKNWAEAEEQLSLEMSRSQEAADYWLETLRSGATPAEAKEITMELIESYYA